MKLDSALEEASRQIKENGYALRFRRKLGEMPKYTGRILAVGIVCQRKVKSISARLRSSHAMLPAIADSGERDLANSLEKAKVIKECFRYI